MSNELMHYGILGMKWGVRRYENADGTLTAAGKQRYNHGRVGSADEWLKQNLKQGKDKPNISRAEDVIKKSKNVADSSRDVIDDVASLRKSVKTPTDLSNMSDQELRAAVNRLNLERQYRDLTESDYKKGEVYATKALSIAGDVLAVALGVVGVASSIYTLRHGE